MANTPGATTVGSLIEQSGDLTAVIFKGVQTGLSTTNFTGNLSSADTNVQLAMDTIDNLS